MKKAEAKQETDKISKGSLGDEETIKERQIYYEAPDGILTVPREVQGFNKEAIREYKKELQKNERGLGRSELQNLP